MKIVFFFLAFLIGWPANAQYTQEMGVKWQPGHYMRIVDDKARGIDGIKGIQTFFNRAESNRFKGVRLELDWVTLEPTPRSYDWTKLRTALGLMRASNRYLLLQVKYKSFSTADCRSVIPSDIPSVLTESSKATGNPGGNCAAPIWTPGVMDRYIELFTEMGRVFNQEDRLVMVSGVGETTTQVSSVDKILWRDQLIRFQAALKTAFPNTLVMLGMNWPGTPEFQDPLVQSIVSSGGGAMSWPDSVPSAYSPVAGWYHYNLAKREASRTAIAPSVQAALIQGDSGTLRNVYNMLMDIGAQIIIWNPGYLSNLIPVLNAVDWRVSPGCPQTINPCVNEIDQQLPVKSAWLGLIESLQGQELPEGMTLEKIQQVRGILGF